MLQRLTTNRGNEYNHIMLHGKQIVIGKQTKHYHEDNVVCESKHLMELRYMQV